MTAAERDQGVTVPPCGAVDEVFGPELGSVCTKPREHDGDHEAICPATGRHVSSWADLPASCPEHGEACGVHGCGTCVRDAFAEWLAFIGPRRVCDGSGMRDESVACPGCAACATAETPCPAFALPDEPWIPDSEKRGPCACCGGPVEKHRRMPLPPDEPPRPGAILGFKVIDADGSDLGTVSDVLRDPR